MLLLNRIGCITKMGLKNFQLRLDENDIEELDKIGNETERSRSFLIRKAVIMFLKKHEVEDDKEFIQ